MRVPFADVFVGRQAIFDRARRVVGYELLFRNSSNEQEAAQINDDALATTQVVSRAFYELGIHTVVGKSRAFINFDAELLLSNVIEALPPDRIVVELLETMEIDERILRRCRELKKLGYRLAWDDFFRYHESCDPILDVMDIVKIDLLRIDRPSLSALVSRLKLRPTILLAEKVESMETAQTCFTLGFSLFQGFFLERPVVVGA